jgi:hypothetical protein
MEEDNLTLATRNKEKYEFYILALTFTILGLSIQTAEFCTFYYQSVIELSSWFLLLLSGLAGLSRQEYIPVAYYAEHRHQNAREYKKGYEEGVQGRRKVLKEDGTAMSESEIQEQLDSLIARLDASSKQNKKIERGIEIKYEIHKYSFIIGLLLLIVSRSVLAISQIN